MLAHTCVLNQTSDKKLKLNNGRIINFRPLTQCRPFCEIQFLGEPNVIDLSPNLSTQPGLIKDCS